jgi:hypothetical protein
VVFMEFRDSGGSESYKAYIVCERRKRPLSHMKPHDRTSGKWLGFLNPRPQISALHDPDAWFPAFASKIAPDFALNEFSDPYLVSKRFLLLEEPFILDEFEAALDSGSV